jgi:hypothetical protein
MQKETFKVTVVKVWLRHDQNFKPIQLINPGQHWLKIDNFNKN